MHIQYSSNNFWKAPWKSSCVSVSMTFVTASFISLIVFITTASELREYAKVTGSKVWTIGMVTNCVDAHLGQIVYDQDGVVDLVHCPGGNATDPIWRVLASSLGISSWTPLKPQHSNPDLNPNPNPLVNQLWCIDFLTPPTPHIIPHRLPAFLESLMPLKKLMLDSCKMLQKQSEAFHTFLWQHFFPRFKTEFYCISFF